MCLFRCNKLRPPFNKIMRKNGTRNHLFLILFQSLTNNFDTFAFQTAPQLTDEQIAGKGEEG